MAVLLSEALSQAPDVQRPFLGLTGIKRYIQKSKHYARDGTPPEEAAGLLMFSTSRQQTWLVATSRRLYCILDDITKAEPNINWSMSRDELVDNAGQLKIRLVTHDNTDRTGLVDIGSDHRDWLYSKSLFASQPVDQAIASLILSKMKS